MGKIINVMILPLLFLFGGTFVMAQETGFLENAARDSAEVKELLHYLASDQLNGRATGTKGIALAAAAIEDRLTSYSIKPYYESFRDSFEVQGKTAFNLMGVLEGNDEELKKEFIILGAHYDHIGQGESIDGDVVANGANDNAAGTVAVVELAKLLSRIPERKRSVLFILFSAEEMGLMGSKHAAETLAAEGLDLYAMLNFEMIGVPMKEKDHLAYVTGYETSNLAEKFNRYAGKKVAGFLPQAKEYQLFKRSDNYPFYEVFQVPSQTFSTFDFTNYPYYHHVFDEADALDVGHMTRFIHCMVPGIERMLNTPEKEIKLHQE